MVRAILIPTLLLFTLPAAAEDELEAKLKAIEARIAQVRADAKREDEARAKIQERMATIDAEIAAAQKIDQTALGASKLDDLRDERKKLESALRGGRHAIHRATRESAAKISSIEKERTPIDFEGLVKKAQKGDPAARAELDRIRTRINQLVAVAQNQPNFGFVQIGGRVQIIRGRAVQQVQIGLGGAKQPKQKASPHKKPKKEAPPAVQEKRAKQDLSDHTERSAKLEQQIIEMTRKVFELEERLHILKQKVAQADRG